MERALEFRVFTPRIPGKPYRAYMGLDKADSAKIRSARLRENESWEETITDQHSKRRYLVKSAPCGIACHCAAEIVAEVN